MNNRKEPLIHISKRGAVPWYAAWAVRGGAVVLALIVVALFFGNRFSVEGSLGYDDVNKVLGKATDFAEGIKDEFKDDSEGQK